MFRWIADGRHLWMVPYLKPRYISGILDRYGCIATEMAVPPHCNRCTGLSTVRKFSAVNGWMDLETEKRRSTIGRNMIP